MGNEGFFNYLVSHRYSDAIVVITSLNQISLDLVDLNISCKKHYFNNLCIHEISSIFPIEVEDYVRSVLFQSESTGYLTLDGIVYIIELIRPEKSLFIFGAGHVGKALSVISSLLDFKVTLVDDRDEFLKDGVFKENNIKVVYSNFEGCFSSLNITSNSLLVIVTRGHQSDEICLSQAVETPAYYIGMIGSKRRALAVVNKVKSLPLADKYLKRLDNIYSPIGLSIGAVTPQEIAIAILAQIIQVSNKRNIST
jgi:xanthine dehydrogenase accessory factor